ncbi:MAG: NADH-quinone oxidoreductase subunit C [Bacillota bacterium]
MNPIELVRELKHRFGESLSTVQDAPDLVMEVNRAGLLEFARFLRDTPGLDFDYLIFITAVDRIDYLEVVYAVRSLREGHQLMFKVKVPSGEPEITSIVTVWPAADWDERETYDLFGVIFNGHPDLRRILLPDDWEGHPLRKSYPVDKRPEKIY